MATTRPRISVDADLWNVVEATAKLRRIHPSTLVEEALNAFLDPSKDVGRLANAVSELMSNATRTNDDIRYIADYIVDKYRSENES
ncbi:hypothetical protein SAMN05216566_1285 [Aureimonas phyllosphaerae]|uniref:Ribbon-helix-helix domain-containing protein n=1 Tax=Aureimonas phyllosphaerae TaxID=1166078 RepID=A0A7W6FWN6_9HYPH|nr:hypothetical protein [Aureimonas phyllosphaerae]MBB3962122.1 hypothetical protein [Aureimonas phyllosphaerae]SFF55818.1 hypothetical protein SAMN05216566_1285 [Aureimonas phyllosphaerae]